MSAKLEDSVGEVVFELKWESPESRSVEQTPTSVEQTSTYDLVTGRMDHALRQTYPFYERLPTASFPPEMAFNLAPYVIQHRFRKEKDGYPLVQTGPKIIAVNDVTEYNWPDFKKNIKEAIAALHKVYDELYSESKQELRTTSLALRYLSAIQNINFEQKTLQFLRKELKTTVSLHKELYKQVGVKQPPRRFDSRFAFDSVTPPGSAYFHFGRGTVKDADALIWDIAVESPQDVERDPDVESWLEDAHIFCAKWYKFLRDREDI